MILLAAHKLEEQGQSPFSAEDLIVMSWREYPRPFGLKGYAEQYPDSNRVLSSIMGERGLARKGWLVKMGQKLYALTKEGQRVVRRLIEGGDEPEPEPEPTPATLPREQEKLLVSLLDSSAMQKFGNNRTQELSFADACRFWGITDNLSSDALDARLESVEQTMRKAERLTARGTILVGHREVTKVDVDLLREVHDQLQERFARHLTLLRARMKG
jgi:hypothetical protein